MAVLEGTECAKSIFALDFPEVWSFRFTPALVVVVVVVREVRMHSVVDRIR